MIETKLREKLEKLIDTYENPYHSIAVHLSFILDTGINKSQELTDFIKTSYNLIEKLDLDYQKEQVKENKLKLDEIYKELRCENLQPKSIIRLIEKLTVGPIKDTDTNRIHHLYTDLQESIVHNDYDYDNIVSLISHNKVNDSIELLRTYNEFANNPTYKKKKDLERIINQLK